MAELAAQRRSEEDLILIRTTLGHMDQALATAADGGAADDAFHAAIAKAAGNPYLAQFSARSEEHTSELQSLMRISYAVFCLKKKKNTNKNTYKNTPQITYSYMQQQHTTQ